VDRPTTLELIDLCRARRNLPVLILVSSRRLPARFVQHLTDALPRGADVEIGQL